MTDPVEWAAHYWREHNLGDHATAFLAMSSSLRFHRLLVDTVERELKPFNLNLTDYMLLMTLELSEAGTRLLSRLARNLLVHATTVTLATDRLEERELLYRHPHPTDRRATSVSLTEAGQELALKATEALKAVDFGMPGSSEAEQQQLIELMASLRAAVGEANQPR